MFGSKPAERGTLGLLNVDSMNSADIGDTNFSILLFQDGHFCYWAMQIFALNARLAAAESMTHDVIRDLLGVKLDMTNYVVNLCILLYSILSSIIYHIAEYMLYQGLLYE